MSDREFLWVAKRWKYKIEIASLCEVIGNLTGSFPMVGLSTQLDKFEYEEIVWPFVERLNEIMNIRNEWARAKRGMSSGTREIV